MNLPISTVIVHNLEFTQLNDKGKFIGRIPMSRRKFWNIAGRAGRALRDTEGHVILLEPDSRWPELNLEEYLNWHLVNLEPVESTLKKVFRQILRIAQDLSFETWRLLFSDEPLIEQFQAEILHAILEGYLDPSQPHTIRQFVNQTLFAYQTDRESREYRRFVDFTRAHVRDVAGQELLDRQFQEYIDTSGLSINSSIKLHNKLVELGIDGLARLVKLRDSNGLLDDQILGDIFNIVFTLREMRPKDAAKQKAVLLSWISGKPLPEIARLHFEDSRRPLEQCSNFIYSQLTNLAPWGLYAFQQMVEYLRQYGYERLTGGTTSSSVSELLYNEELSFLPLYANFGVNDPVAAYLCLLGVERIDSLLLTKQYRETDTTLIPPLDEVKRWLVSVEANTIREWFERAKRPLDEYLFDICRRVQRELDEAGSR